MVCITEPINRRKAQAAAFGNAGNKHVQTLINVYTGLNTDKTRFLALAFKLLVYNLSNKTVGGK